MTSHAPLRAAFGVATSALLGITTLALGADQYRVEGIDRERGPYTGQLEIGSEADQPTVVRTIRFRDGGAERLTGRAEWEGARLRALLIRATGAEGALSGTCKQQLDLRVRFVDGRCWTQVFDDEQVVSRGHGALPGKELAYADDHLPKGGGKMRGKRANELQSEFATSRFRGHAFIRGEGDDREIHPNDPHQGRLGDCYVIAAMIATAKTKPDVIRRLIAERGNGTYQVRLSRLGWWKQTVDVQVSDVFPWRLEGGAQIFAFGGSPDRLVENGRTYHELWPALIEKAYAKHQGSYAALEGGHADTAFEFLSGKSASRNLTFFYGTQGLANLIRRARAKGHPICIGTKADSGDLGMRLNLLDGHVYVLWEVRGGRYVLHNPWQRSHPSRALSASELKRVASHVYVGEF